VVRVGLRSEPGSRLFPALFNRDLDGLPATNEVEQGVHALVDLRQLAEYSSAVTVTAESAQSADVIGKVVRKRLVIRGLRCGCAICRLFR